MRIEVVETVGEPAHQVLDETRASRCWSNCLVQFQLVLPWSGLLACKDVPKRNAPLSQGALIWRDRLRVSIYVTYETGSSSLLMFLYLQLQPQPQCERRSNAILCEALQSYRGCHLVELDRARAAHPMARRMRMEAYERDGALNDMPARSLEVH